METIDRRNPRSIILYNASDSCDALNSLYRLLKRERPVVSHSWFCKRARIRSRGYIANVLSARNILHMKYLASVSRVLELSSEQRLVLLALLSADHSKKSGDDDGESETVAMVKSAKERLLSSN